MKILKNEEHAAMKQAADNWNKLLNLMKEDNPDMQEEAVTVESIVEAMEANNASEELRQQLDTAREDLNQKDSKIQNLEATITELKGTPSAGSAGAGVTVKNEPGSEEEDIKDFAAKHAGDTAAIMDQAKSTNFFNV